MWLRVAILVLFAAYVVYRIGLGWRIVRAKRRGDRRYEESLRRQAFWSMNLVIGVLLVGVLLFLGLAALN